MILQAKALTEKLVITSKESQMLCAIVNPNWKYRVLHSHPHSLQPSLPSGYTVDFHSLRRVIPQDNAFPDC